MSMDAKGPEDLAQLQHGGMLCETRAPGKVANFPGSLVTNQLKDNLKTSSYPKDKASLANWIAYFREGWDDPGIWKSAVRN